MSGRGSKVYYRRDNGKAISDEDIYTMVMLHQYQRKSINQIASQFSLDPFAVRVLVGKRVSGSCCG